MSEGTQTGRKQLPTWVVALVLGSTLTAVGVIGWRSATDDKEGTFEITDEDMRKAHAERDAEEMARWDLTTAKIPVESIVSGGPRPDGIPALISPPTVSASESDFDERLRVLGVEMGGSFRAYPVAVLNWHEVINDDLGGEPIAVSFCPLCDSAVAFERRIGGKAREFGISGHLYNSNTLLFDRQADSKQESLWSQLRFEAVTGPAAVENLKLTPIDVEMTSWGAWKRAHPESSVVTFETGHKKPYRRSPYARYLSDDKIPFRMSGGTDRRKDAKNKSRVVVVDIEGAKKAYLLRDLVKAPDRTITDEVSGHPVTLVLDPKGGVEVRSDAPVTRHYGFWFAIDAFEPDVPVYSPA